MFERINGFETSSRTKRRSRVTLEIEKEHCCTVFEVGEQALLILLEHEALVRRGEFHWEEAPRGIIENIPFVSHPCRSGIHGKAARDSSKGRRRHQVHTRISLPHGKKICVFCLIRREGYQKREDSLLERRSFLGSAVSSVTGSKSIRDETRESE